jgi:crotonobetaine/carnitine-CoA ligase
VEFKESLPKTPTERVEKYKLRQEGVTANTWDREKAGIKLDR